MHKKNLFISFFLLSAAAILLSSILFLKIKKTPEIKKSSSRNILPDAKTANLSSLVEAENMKPDLNLKNIAETHEAKDKATRALQNIKSRGRLPSQTLTKPSVLQAHSILTGTRWKIWPNANVVAKLSSDAPVARVSHIDIAEGEPSQSTIVNFDNTNQIVLYNERLQKPGILTGLIIVETVDLPALRRDLSSVNAEIVNSFDQINTYFVTGLAQSFNLELLFTQIKKWPHVRNAELEILSKNYEKN